MITDYFVAVGENDIYFSANAGVTWDKWSSSQLESFLEFKLAIVAVTAQAVSRLTAPHAWWDLQSE